MGPVLNVLTMGDMVVVDGVLATSYTDILHLSPFVQSLLTLPLKMLHILGFGKFARLVDTSANHIAHSYIIRA